MDVTPLLRRRHVRRSFEQLSAQDRLTRGIIAVGSTLAALMGGLIIGGAFGAIITALTDNILMPVIGSFIGKSFNSLTAVINGVPVQYGAFIQAIVKFVIIAFFLFLLIKAMNAMKKKEPVPPATTPEDITLLREIRDALKK